MIFVCCCVLLCSFCCRRCLCIFLRFANCLGGSWVFCTFFWFCCSELRELDRFLLLLFLFLLVIALLTFFVIFSNLNLQGGLLLGGNFEVIWWSYWCFAFQNWRSRFIFVAFEDGTISSDIFFKVFNYTWCTFGAYSKAQLEWVGILAELDLEEEPYFLFQGHHMIF